MDICGIMVRKGDKKKERYLNFIYSVKCGCTAAQMLHGSSRTQCVRGSPSFQTA